MIFGNRNAAALLRLPSPGMMDDPRTGGITGNLPSWANMPAMAGNEAPEVDYRPGQPFVATQGQAIPQEYYRGGQPAMMPISGDRINWETASPAERDKGLAAMQGRMQSAIKGFALPDVSKYGYSPESQGRVEGAGYLRETPVGIFGGGTAPASVPGNAPVGPVLEATQAPGSPRWSVEGFDAMREQAKAPSGILASSGPRGLFGNGRSFDYASALSAILPEEKKPSTLQKIAQVLGPALMAASGNEAGANMLLADLMRQRAEKDRRRYDTARTIADWQHDDYSRTDDAALKASAPFTIGRDRLVYNPFTGTTENIWHGPADWESYAESQGLKPGTEEYFKAVEDYVLRGAGPSAMENYGGLDDRRTENDLRLETARAGNRTSLEAFRQKGQTALEGLRQRGQTSLETLRQTGRVNLRATPSYRDLHGAPGKTKRITATGPGGKTVEWDGKAWVPVK